MCAEYGLSILHIAVNEVIFSGVLIQKIGKFGGSRQAFFSSKNHRNLKNEYFLKIYHKLNF